MTKLVILSCITAVSSNESENKWFKNYLKIYNQPTELWAKMLRAQNPQALKYKSTPWWLEPEESSQWVHASPNARSVFVRCTRSWLLLETRYGITCLLWDEVIYAPLCS